MEACDNMELDTAMSDRVLQTAVTDGRADRSGSRAVGRRLSHKGKF